MTHQFLDIATPFRFGPDGQVVTSADTAALAESIKAILQTMPGERRHQPDFGSNVHALLFGNITPLLLAQVEIEAREAIARWEPAVVVDEVRVTREQSSVVLTIAFRPRIAGAEASEASIRIDTPTGV